MDWKLALGIPATVVSVITAWGLLGFPRVATSADIHKLTIQQSAIASEVYAGKVRNLLSVKPPEDPAARQIWTEEIDRARMQQKRAEDRVIELSK